MVLVVLVLLLAVHAAASPALKVEQPAQAAAASSSSSSLACATLVDCLRSSSAPATECNLSAMVWCDDTQLLHLVGRVGDRLDTPGSGTGASIQTSTLPGDSNNHVTAAAAAAAAAPAAGRGVDPQQTPLHETEALIAFYQTFGGKNWGASSNFRPWPIDPPPSNVSTLTPCDWSGVICTDTKHIQMLNLARINAYGNITKLPIVLAPLDRLFHLGLAGNLLHGELDAAAWNAMPHLASLAIMGNTLVTGKVPLDWICTAPTNGPSASSSTALKKAIDIAGTGVAGFSHTKQVTKCDGLASFNADGTDLNGDGAGLPLQLLHSPTLTSLRCQACGLTGAFPDFKAPELDRIDLSANELEGPLPLNWTRCLPMVRDLFLDYNGLEVPTDDDVALWTGLELLKTFSMNGNRAGEPDLLPLPRQLFNTTRFPRMTTIHLNDNMLHGPIPTLMPSSPIRSIDLSANRLTPGHLGLVDNTTMLANLILSGNDLNTTLGELGMGPAARVSVFRCSLCGLRGGLTTWQDADSVILDSNFLSGPIPEGFKAAETLILSYNHITGPLPASIVNDPPVTVDLSQNRIVGDALFPLFCMNEVARKARGRRRPVTIRAAGNQLGGDFPVNCTAPYVKTIDLSNNFFDGSGLDNFFLALDQPEVVLLSSNPLRYIPYGQRSFQSFKVKPFFSYFSLSNCSLGTQTPTDDDAGESGATVGGGGGMTLVDVLVNLYSRMVLESDPRIPVPLVGNLYFGSLDLSMNGFDDPVEQLLAIEPILKVFRGHTLEIGDNALQGSATVLLSMIGKHWNTVSLAGNTNITGSVEFLQGTLDVRRTSTRGLSPNQLSLVDLQRVEVGVNEDGNQNCVKSIYTTSGQSIDVSPSFHWNVLCECLPGFFLNAPCPGCSQAETVPAAKQVLPFSSAQPALGIHAAGLDGKSPLLSAWNATASGSAYGAYACNICFDGGRCDSEDGNMLSVGLWPVRDDEFQLVDLVACPGTAAKILEGDLFPPDEEEYAAKDNSNNKNDKGKNSQKKSRKSKERTGKSFLAATPCASFDSAIGTVHCAKGYSDRLCNRCVDDGSVYRSGFQCKSCPYYAWLALAVPIGSIIVQGSLVIFTEAPSAGTFRILVLHVTLLSAFLSFNTGRVLTEELQDSMSWSSSVAAFSMPGLECVMRGFDYPWRFWTALMVPLEIALLVLVPLCIAVVPGMRVRFVPKVGAMAAYLTIQMMYNTIKSLSSMLSCTAYGRSEYEADSYVSHALWIPCDWDGRWGVMAVVAMIAVAVYGVATPLGLGWLLRKHHAQDVAHVLHDVDLLNENENTTVDCNTTVDSNTTGDSASTSAAIPCSSDQGDDGEEEEVAQVVLIDADYGTRGNGSNAKEGGDEVGMATPASIGAGETSAAGQDDEHDPADENEQPEEHEEEASNVPVPFWHMARAGAYNLLQAPYKTELYYWEIVLLFRSMLLAFTAGFVPFSSTWLSVLMLGIMSVFTMLQVRIRPFAVPLDNTMELASLCILTYTFFVGSMDTFGNVDFGVQAAWTVLILNGLVVLVLAVVSVVETSKGVLSFSRRLKAVIKEKYAAHKHRRSIRRKHTTNNKNGKGLANGPTINPSQPLLGDRAV